MRIPQIQGLRALAAILVTLFHAHFVPGGFIGVDIFYVISGYLITNLILREVAKTGSLDLKAFYQRRIKRLLPTSFFVLILSAIITWIAYPAIVRDSIARDLIAASLYISNYLFAWWQNDYQNLNATPSPFIHYWSLAVEEQFYLIWPIFILILTQLKSRKKLIVGISVATLLSFVLSLYQTQVAPIWAFYSIFTRAWELGIGALLIFIPTNRGTPKYLPLLGFIAILYSALVFNETTPFPGYAALLPVLGTAILISCVKDWPPILNDSANNRFSQWLGRISYPLYLWHWPALVIPSTTLGRALNMPEKILCIALTIVLAHLTHIWVEEPFRYKKLSPRTLYKGVAAAALTSVSLGLIIAVTSSDLIKVKGLQNVEFSFSRVSERPKVYEDGCHVNYRNSKSDECAYGDLKSKHTIVLYGDSHAAQWFPTLERIALDRHLKLISLTKSACPAVDVVRNDQGAFKNSLCRTWRKSSLERITKLAPDAVITSSYWYFNAPNQFKDRLAWWSDGQKKLLAGLRQTSPHLIFIGDTPQPKLDIPSCLVARVVTKCDNAVPSPFRIVSGFARINPTTWLCDGRCPAIRKGIVAYRDASHISVEMALSLVSQLDQALAQKGVFAP